MGTIQTRIKSENETKIIVAFSVHSVILFEVMKDHYAQLNESEIQELKTVCDDLQREAISAQEIDNEIARETAKYMATTTPEERAEDDLHIQRGYDEDKTR